MLIEQRAIENQKSNITQNPTLQSSESTSVARLNLRDNAPKKTRAEKLAAIDELMSDFDRKVAWVEKQLYKAIDGGFYWWNIERVTKAERPEFAAILARLRLRDPAINRAIDSVNYIDRNSVTVWFWVGANHG